MSIVGVGAEFCMGYWPNIRNGTAIAAPAVWVSPPMDLCHADSTINIVPGIIIIIIIIESS